jgi:hypothetical protein
MNSKQNILYGSRSKLRNTPLSSAPSLLERLASLEELQAHLNGLRPNSEYDALTAAYAFLYDLGSIYPGQRAQLIMPEPRHIYRSWGWFNLIDEMSKTSVSIYVPQAKSLDQLRHSDQPLLRVATKKQPWSRALISVGGRFNWSAD